METISGLFPRQSPTSGYGYGNGYGSGGVGDACGDSNSCLEFFLRLFHNPFQAQIQSTSFYAALIWSFAVSSGFFLLFCLLRPRTSNIYAPRAKHADQKHKPPPVGKGLFSWIMPIKSAKESDLVERIGLDATVFLRFLRMGRNMFLGLTVVGCGVLIPVTLANYNNYLTDTNSADTVPGGSASGRKAVAVFIKLTPQFMRGSPFWAYVVVAYIFNFIIFFFLWWNYRAVARLRRVYFESSDYRHSLHSRTLLMTQIPSSYRNEDSVVRLIQEKKPTQDIPKVAVARSIKDLPELIKAHQKAVLKLEAHLAKYLADPNKLPPNRPTCKPQREDSKHVGGGKVDAIDYYTSRIQWLEHTIKNVRETVDLRNALPYGFVSYTHIEDAHAVAYATRSSGPMHTIVRLAPKPNDILWKNLPMGRAQRGTQSAWNSFWILLLTVLFIPPNLLIAVFLTNLHNLGYVWQDFNTSLLAHPTAWSIVQGILAPLVNVLIYLALPMIFRRLLVRAGDTTKTSRERHVCSKLYAFVVFNNLFIFTIFGTIFAFVAAAIQADAANFWNQIKYAHLGTKIAISLCTMSPYWITWQLQRNLSAAIDILQAWPLIKNTFLKRFTNPTPRQLVEITAPQTFEYAEYYYNYLFVITIGLAFGALQPLILPVTALYLAVDSWLKSYMLQYIFITKVESGGAFWRMLFNRMLFAVLVLDAIVALVVGTLGDANPMLYAMAPLLVILPAFKIYCAKSFDTRIGYYTTKSYSEAETGGRITPGAEKKLRRNQDRVAVKYGHPALYEKLMTPMVHAKSQHLLREIYGGRLGAEDPTKYDNNRPGSVFGYSDIYMGEMDSQRPGKMFYGGVDSDEPAIPFEMVGESELDFENFKRRADFRYQYGGDGELYGRAEDRSSRPTTPSSMMSFGATTLMSPSSRRTSEVLLKGTPTEEQDIIYPRGYAQVGPSSREASPARSGGGRTRTYSGHLDGPYSPPVPVRQPMLSSVDIPTPGLDREEVAAAGYFTTQGYDDRRIRPAASAGSMGEMLNQAAPIGYSAAPTRVPVGSAARTGPWQHQNNHSGSGSGTAYSTPQQMSPYDDNTSYDYFRRGRM